MIYAYAEGSFKRSYIMLKPIKSEFAFCVTYDSKMFDQGEVTQI